MPVRVLTLAGAGSYAVAGPLLAGAAWTAGGGWWLVLGVLAAWAGVGGVLGALLLVVREDHRQLRRLTSRTDRLADQVTTQVAKRVVARIDASERHHAEVAATQATAMEELARTVSGTVSGELAADRRQVLATLDARILGLRELLRERT